MNIPKNCKECKHIGDYTSGPYARNPHYCCELIWKLYDEDYRVNPNTIDENCPLVVGINLEEIRNASVKKG